MAKPKRRSTRSQSSRKPTDAVERLTIDQAFQRLLTCVQKPYVARNRLEQAILDGEVTLWGREAQRSWFRVKPDFFKQHLHISLDESPEGWHACVAMQAGKIGVQDFEQYEWMVPANEIEALQQDKTVPGAKRGPKEKYPWELFKAKFYLDLYDDDVPAHGDVNFEQRAKRKWGSEHPEIGEESTPSQNAMRTKVTEWASLWPRLRAGNK
jgi:hypothetical protein